MSGVVSNQTYGRLTTIEWCFKRQAQNLEVSMHMWQRKTCVVTGFEERKYKIMRLSCERTENTLFTRQARYETISHLANDESPV